MIQVEADPDPRHIEQINHLFLSILPALRKRVAHLSRYWPPARKEESLAEASAIALAACHNLFRRKQIEKIHTAGFREYILKALRQGRCFADDPGRGDVLAPNGKRQHRRRVYSLEDRPLKSPPVAGDVVGCFNDMLSDSKQSVMDQVAFRLDFGSWLEDLPERDRQMMMMLASGEKPVDVAARLGISQAAVSQRRKVWKHRWEDFIAA